MSLFFKGTGVALVTPFQTNKEIDFPALKQLVNHCIDGGVEFLVVLGTTGESVTLSKDEKQRVLNFVAEVNAGRLPLVAGCGGNNTAAVINDLKSYDFSAYQAILSVSPAYNKPTQEGIYQHFMAIVEQSPLPIILYNVPGRTAKNMTAETVLRLANASDQFIAVKEASGDLAQCMKIVQSKPANFLVLSGDDNLTLPMISTGMHGVISVVANAYPRVYSDMVRYALSGDFEQARPLHYSLLDLIDMLFVEGNPAGVKSALKGLNVCPTDDVRLPLVPVSVQLAADIEEQRKLIK